MAGGRFDNAIRDLVDRSPEALATWLLGEPITRRAVRRAASDLPAEPMEADAVLRVRGIERSLQRPPGDL